MQLLVFILKKTELMDQLLRSMANGGVKGATIMEGHGMAEALVNMEDLPMFGVLRRVISDPEKETCKVLLLVETDEQIIKTRQIIKEVVGDLNEPNTGIMFSIPITYVEGMVR